jgi:hypothetical protein
VASALWQKARPPQARKEKMAEFGLVSAQGMHGILNTIEADLSDWRWMAAHKWIEDADAEARRQLFSGLNKTAWRAFVACIYQLRIAIKAEDQGGCSEMLAELRALLGRIDGPPLG